MEIWSKLDGFTGWYYLPTYDSFYLHVFLKSAVCLLLCFVYNCRANGQEFQNSKATFDSIAGMDSITDEFCQKG